MQGMPRLHPQWDPKAIPLYIAQQQAPYLTITCTPVTSEDQHHPLRPEPWHPEHPWLYSSNKLSRPYPLCPCSLLRRRETIHNNLASSICLAAWGTLGHCLCGLHNYEGCGTVALVAQCGITHQGQSHVGDRSTGDGQKQIQVLALCLQGPEHWEKANPKVLLDLKDLTLQMHWSMPQWTNKTEDSCFAFLCWQKSSTTSQRNLSWQRMGRLLAKPNRFICLVILWSLLCGKQHLQLTQAQPWILTENSFSHKWVRSLGLSVVQSVVAQDTSPVSKAWTAPRLRAPPQISRKKGVPEP